MKSKTQYTRSKINLLLYIFLLTFICPCHNEPIDILHNSEDNIAVNSELYGLIRQVAKGGNSVPEPEPEHEEITCIEFNYPLTIFTFDETSNYLSTEVVTDNDQFVVLLGSLFEYQSISISYPINGTLDDGTAISISTNEELKEAIDNCVKEELVDNCNQALETCTWTVIYMENSENEYLGGVFTQSNGLTTFEFDNNLFSGSWSSLFIGEELHINIHLNQDSELSDYWNKDWRVITYSDNFEFMTLLAGEEMVTIRKSCEINEACTNKGFTFYECELTENPGYATFDFENYSDCILDLILIEGISDAENIETTYYLSYDDADGYTNNITETYTSETQIVWARIQNLDSPNYLIVPIMAYAISC